MSWDGAERTRRARSKLPCRTVNFSSQGLLFNVPLMAPDIDFIGKSNLIRLLQDVALIEVTVL